MTVTKHDGTNETIGPYRTDTTGGTGVTAVTLSGALTMVGGSSARIAGDDSQGALRHIRINQNSDLSTTCTDYQIACVTFEVSPKSCGDTLSAGTSSCDFNT